MPPIGREVSPGHRVVSASMLPEKLEECPHCGSKTFTIIGNFQRPYEIKVTEGTAEQPVLSSQVMNETDGIACEKCGIHTLIEDDTVFEREGLIFDLTTQIAILQGKTGVQPAAEKEWKN